MDLNFGEKWSTLETDLNGREWVVLEFVEKKLLKVSKLANNEIRLVSV